MHVTLSGWVRHLPRLCVRAAASLRRSLVRFCYCEVYSKSIKAPAHLMHREGTLAREDEMKPATEIDPYDATSIFYATAMIRIQRKLRGTHDDLETLNKCGSSQPSCDERSSDVCQRCALYRRRLDFRMLLRELSPYIAEGSGGPVTTASRSCLVHTIRIGGRRRGRRTVA